MSASGPEGSAGSAGSADDGYSGPATLEHGSVSVPCEVVLTGFFEPIAGRYKWYGRASAAGSAGSSGSSGSSGAGFGDLPRKGVRLRTPHGSAETTVSDEDPWGRWRLQGFGAPPFPRAEVHDGS